MFESKPAAADAVADAPGTDADALACTGGNINGGGNGGKNGNDGLFLGTSITFTKKKNNNIQLNYSLVCLVIILVFDGKFELSLNDEAVDDDGDCE